ncbi:hypothetical protein [Pseudooceanicola marinus]|uniref:hypothetical protein n=1 Tax=Pseudooceanicola marinus TaxID=396013 RepID=UPI00117B73A3|nr:hypothetical protein [Pseudooceanicola marinus]
MKRTLTFLFVSVMLLSFLGVTWVSFRLVAYVAAGASELKPNEYVPLFVAFVTAVVGLVGALYTQNRIRKREVDSAHRPKKMEIYFSFIAQVERQMLYQKEELGLEAIDDAELVREMMRFKSLCLLWGSAEVLRALSEFQRVSASQPSPKSMLRSVDALYRAMRKDIGLSNVSLPKDFFAKWPLSNPGDFDRLDE